MENSFYATITTAEAELTLYFTEDAVHFQEDPTGMIGLYWDMGSNNPQEILRRAKEQAEEQELKGTIEIHAIHEEGSEVILTEEVDFAPPWIITSNDYPQGALEFTPISEDFQEGLEEAFNKGAEYFGVKRSSVRVIIGQDEHPAPDPEWEKKFVYNASLESDSVTFKLTKGGYEISGENKEFEDDERCLNEAEQNVTMSGIGYSVFSHTKLVITQYTKWFNPEDEQGEHDYQEKEDTEYPLSLWVSYGYYKKEYPKLLNRLEQDPIKCDFPENIEELESNNKKYFPSQGELEEQIGAEDIPAAYFQLCYTNEEGEDIVLDTLAVSKSE